MNSTVARSVQVVFGVSAALTGCLVIIAVVPVATWYEAIVAGVVGVAAVGLGVDTAVRRLT